MLRIRVYRDGRATDEKVPLDQLGRLAKDPDATVWIDLDSPDPETIEALRDQLGFHKLAVEDVLGTRQRPKLETYGDHFFLTAYVTAVGEAPNARAGGRTGGGAGRADGGGIGGADGASRGGGSGGLAGEEVGGVDQEQNPVRNGDVGPAESAVDGGPEESGALLDPRLRSTEVSAFITDSVVVVVPGGSGFDADEVLRRAEENADICHRGSGFLVYSLLDYLVDRQLEAAEALDACADDLGSLLFAHRPQDVQLRSFRLHKELTSLRRVLIPMREVLSAVLRHQSAPQPGLAPPNAELLPYFQDVYDHVLRAVDWTESARDMVNNVLQTFLTIQGNNMNVIMKKVTSWAAIIAVPTAITGFYGMNVPYPGVGTQWGAVLAAVLMALLSVGLYAIFKRKNWL
ncbi:magnesium transporter CorA family protein [Paenarthrobacter sp. PH39-S1]|uniref:magnesium transporter CorA family protein n=1 Tax=Paenarthrobacter sp. PH39-S1 TaxID=3046204 RepID=UPI0024BA2F2E|nr:magnesium transporter CorA family protein [Paenarthrobacter sp. PH39-S1]MDJ0357227.1 magnesium transporter CorA family protein [Paenarthrobacter sp. PH39-S1]